MTMGLPTIPPGPSDFPFRSIAISITRRVLLLSLVGGIGLVSILFMGLWITLDQVQARMDKINTEAINTFDHFFLDIQSNLQATSDGLAAREDKNSELLNLHMRNSAFLDVIFINSDGTIAAQRNAVGRPKQTKIEEKI